MNLMAKLPLSYCDKKTFFNHIQSHFTDGMNWNRMNEIHIDHSTPINYSSGDGEDLTLERKFGRLCYTNCRPLWSAENIKKGNKYITHDYFDDEINYDNDEELLNTIHEDLINNSQFFQNPADKKLSI